MLNIVLKWRSCESEGADAADGGYLVRSMCILWMSSSLITLRVLQFRNVHAE